MDLEGTTVRLYAEDMMAFAMLEHAIEWRATIEADNALAKDVKVRFHPAVGRVMVSNARGAWKRELERMTPVVLDCVKTREDFIKYGRMYARSLFDRVGFTPFTVLKVFTFMTEFAIAYYKRMAVMADAPETAVNFITDVLESPEGSSVLNSRLNALNEAARNILIEKLASLKNPISRLSRHANSSQSNKSLSRPSNASRPASSGQVNSLNSGTNLSGQTGSLNDKENLS